MINLQILMPGVKNTEANLWEPGLLRVLQSRTVGQMCKVPVNGLVTGLPFNGGHSLRVQAGRVILKQAQYV